MKFGIVKDPKEQNLQLIKVFLTQNYQTRLFLSDLMQLRKIQNKLPGRIN